MNKTKKSIIEAAINIFSKRGYNGATIDEIVLEAGVVKGTLYYHFKSKEEIFNFIIDEGIKVLQNHLKDIDNENIDPLEKLKNICRIQLTMLYKNKEFFRVLISQLWGQEIRQLQIRTRLLDYFKEIEIYIKEAMDEGLIKKGDANFMAHTFFGVLISSAVYEIFTIDKVDLDKVINNLIDVSFYGLIGKN
ncbi:TetR/AcrR family transcriptional regulator [Clostridium fallax]|uniref:Transcriptional regulator, TetR family n=1 Tax=Clostridium fallax TaxID=1533 RepID=A0A1M4W3F6_9CLOT|nr:TetR/AcrR family transcriptional regulator [Clostridium fallax]SHE75670.1 transcriptional regulator, TetR family [Clostridium fallax]SQB22856.1 TetR family transcriptional regulator [Clostridium fallax]